jgi:hypothetical protein
MILDLFGNPIPPNGDVSKKKESTQPQQSHYRAKIDSFYHPEVFHGIRKSNLFDMPVIEPNLRIPKTVLTTPFDRIKGEKSNQESIVMFYTNDDRFYSRLSHPWDYIDLLKSYSGVIGPDLSQYIDMDYVTRLYHCYWDKVFTAYYQLQGVNIYPNVTWSLPDSYEYSIAGFPKKSVIAINSMGVPKYHFSKALWLKGYYYVVEQLEPILILRYGPKIKGEHEELSMYLENEQLNIVRHGCKRK